jgi:hypothetical protein
MVMARRDLLEYLQGRLIEEFDDTTGKDAAVIAKTLVEVNRELETLPTGEVSTVDDLAKRRADRRSAASG